MAGLLEEAAIGFVLTTEQASYLYDGVCSMQLMLIAICMIRPEDMNNATLANRECFDLWYTEPSRYDPSVRGCLQDRDASTQVRNRCGCLPTLTWVLARYRAFVEGLANRALPSPTFKGFTAVSGRGNCVIRLFGISTAVELFLLSYHDRFIAKIFLDKGP